MTAAGTAERFQALHWQGCFVLPNAWDAGSARILAGLGFEAIAATSAGLAFTLGRRDGRAAVSRAEALANARDIVAATPLPVSADLEDGYGPSPEDCAETVRLAAAAGRPAHVHALADAQAQVRVALRLGQDAGLLPALAAPSRRAPTSPCSSGPELAAAHGRRHCCGAAPAAALRVPGWIVYTMHPRHTQEQGRSDAAGELSE